MDLIILDNIAFEFDIPALLKRIRVDESDPLAEEIRDLAARAHEAARPKAVMKAAYIDSRGPDFIMVDGVKLTSKVLARNTETVHRVFPYVITCGTEIEAWSKSLGDPLLQFYSDAIKEAALRAAIAKAWKHMETVFGLGKVSTMNPGSLKDWPLEEQRPLFKILGKGIEAIGVTLTDSCLMLPVKTVSGLRFPTETTYENCQLCPREVCPGRRAPYDKKLAKDKYGI